MMKQLTAILPVGALCIRNLPDSMVRGITHLSAAFLLMQGLVSAGEVRTLSTADLLRPAQKVEDLVADVKGQLQYEAAGGGTWRLQGELTKGRTTVILRPQSGSWDISKFSYFRVDIVNKGEGLVWIEGRLDNAGAQDWMNSAPSEAFLMPGEQGTLGFAYPRTKAQNDAPKLFDGLYGKPNGYRHHWKRFDPANVVACRLVIASTSPNLVLEDITFSMAQPYGAEVNAELLELPYLDRMGQVRKLDWPGKLKSEEDLKRRNAEEQRQNAENMGPAEFDKYGGWLKGPQLDATGFFRVTDYNGKWWFVDPDGRLFFSHGLNSIGFEASTPVAGREKLFAWLPGKEDPLGKCLSKKQGETMNFMLANIIRTFGEEWEKPAKARVHQRLRWWGLNTLGAWSDEKLTRDARTPYTGIIHLGHHGSPLGRGVSDPFAESFKAQVRKALENFRKSHGEDPWCIGLFIDNEIDWDDHVVERILAADSKLAARQFVMGWLKEKYKTVQAFNNAWEYSFDSWDAVKGPPVPKRSDVDKEAETAKDTESAKADKLTLIGLIAEEYYRVCRETLKKVLPNHLYLGSRIHRAPKIVVTTAAKYVDVMSQNRYAYGANNGSLPPDVDKPVICTEFHFAAPDRGVPGVGLLPVGDQLQRSRAYVAYVVSALESRNVVGTHWFAYPDQSAAGRPGEWQHSENNQIGFVDITDSPYPEITGASRVMADQMYRIRAGERGDFLSALQSLWGD
jgi:hypothetical protein